MSVDWASGLWTALASRWLGALVATGLLALAALWRRSVSPSGAVAGLVVGVVFWLCGDWPLWTLLTVFFLSSSLLGIPAKKWRPRLEAKHQRGSRRSWQQVAANTSPMLLAALGLLFTEAAGLTAWSRALTVGVVTGFAAAASDTWAGEIGVLSSRPPRLLWGLSPVEAGQSGGVTWLGMVGALAGALVLSSVGLLAGIGAMGMALAAGIAFLSSLTDSLLGGTLQSLYRDRTGSWTERPVDPDGMPQQLARGLRWLNNDAVNLVSVALAVATAAVLALALT